MERTIRLTQPILRTALTMVLTVPTTQPTVSMMALTMVSVPMTRPSLTLETTAATIPTQAMMAQTTLEMMVVTMKISEMTVVMTLEMMVEISDRPSSFLFTLRTAKFFLDIGFAGSHVALSPSITSSLALDCLLNHSTTRQNNTTIDAATGTGLDDAV
ncbi:hypothetical protein CPB84DRAFT_844749 [Gymnopilus junonius]|uniref:Uncharacterized protein n=1 Tax=Gymnopilus junonius TaxID=109634 RepID=A0A9P5TP38_GYMJU|nr:hypothetical protein CPB84DRAFT_844749 [Gymnopilus junonius]